jgi:1-acyl-sn-glycerol-3-phosphate acyltransferase
LVKNNKNSDQPDLPGAARNALTNALYFVSRVGVTSVSKTLFRLEVTGAENFPKSGPCMIVANHVSHFDPPVLSMITRRRITYLAKKPLFEAPLLGSYLRQLDCISVDRDATELSTIRDCIKTLKSGLPLVVFPEGSRSEDGELQEGQRGVGMIWARANVPAVPVFIKGTEKILPPGEKIPSLHSISLRVGQPFLPFEDFKLASHYDDYYSYLAECVMRRLRALKAVAE